MYKNIMILVYKILICHARFDKLIAGPSVNALNMAVFDFPVPRLFNQGQY